MIFQHPYIREVAGVAAMVIIILAASLKDNKISRSLNFIGSVALITYGVTIRSFIVVTMSFSLTIIHMCRVYKKPKLDIGCIIIGYQGIGKSTLASTSSRYIDLESGTFWIDDKRDPDWYQIYCKIAIELAVQGYRVFTSSHMVVREYLTTCPLPEFLKVYVCYPELSLKYSWIAKLETRYKLTQLNKDYKAWMNAVDRFDENIQELKDCSAVSIPITSMKYDLDSLVDSYVKSK